MAHFVYPVANSGQPAYAAQTAYVAAAPQPSFAPGPRAHYDGYQQPTQHYAYAARPQVSANYDQPKAYYQPVQQTPTAAQFTAAEFQQPQPVNTQKVHPSPIVKPAFSSSTYSVTPRQTTTKPIANVQVTPSAVSASYVYPSATSQSVSFSSSSFSTSSAFSTNYENALYTAATNYYQQQQSGKTGGGGGRFTNYRSGGYRGNRGGGTGGGARSGPPRNLQVHYCEVCKVSCAGPLTYKEHLEGQKHKKKEASAAAAASSSTRHLSARQANNIRCELCDVVCTGNDAYAAHIRGVKHKKVVKLHTSMGKPIPSTDLPILKKVTPSVTAKKPEMTLITPIASNKKIVYGTPKINFVGGTTLKSLGVKPEEVKEVKPVETPEAADEEEDDLDEVQPVGHEYLEEVHDGKGLSFHCKLCECKFNDPNAKEMHMKGRRHRLAYKKKVDPSLVVDVKYNSGTRRMYDNRRRFPRVKNRRNMQLMDDIRMEEEMYWDNRRRMQSDLEFYERANNQAQVRRMESADDRHVMAKHDTIYPKEDELTVVQNIVSACEKGLKLVSDFLTEGNQSKDTAKEATKETDKKPTPLSTSKEDGNDTAPTPTVPDGSSSRVLKGVMRVGVLAKGLLLHKNLSTHLVVLCAEKPTRTLLERIAECLPNKLSEVAQEKYEVRRCTEEAAIIVSNDVEPRTSCTITLTSPVMREGNVPDSEVSVKDPPDVLDRHKCLAALAALRHAKWFQARANGMQSCVMVIRIMRDLCQRVPTWAPLSQWALELIVEKCLSSAGVPIHPGEALRRVFEALAAGILLPGGPGIMDPCEKEAVDASNKLTNQQREEITASAQHALRLIAFRQIHKVLGMEFLPQPKQFPGGRFATSRKRRLPNEGEEVEEDEKKEKKDEASTEASVSVATT